MTPVIRLVGAVVLLAAMAPLVAAQGVDCSNVPPSMGAPDPAYAVCAPNGTSTEGGGTTHLVYQSGVLSRIGAPPLSCPYVPPNGGSLNGGDYRGDDDRSNWYGVDHLGQAVRILLSTCTPTQLGTMGSGWSSVTYDYTTGTFYGLQVTACGSGSRLYALDFDTVTATPIGAVDPTNACGLALAAHPTTGQLYGYDIISDQFLAIDKTTGQSTVIGPIGFDANFTQGMDCDAADGTCYLYAFNNVSFVAELRRVNLVTGNTMLVGTLGSGPSSAVSTGSAEGLLPNDCEQDLSATLDNDNPALGETITFTVTVTNNSTSPAPLDLWIHADGQHVNFIRRLASGTLTGNTTVTRDVRVRVPTPLWVAGTWVVRLHIGGFSYDICDTESFIVEVSPSLTGGDAGAAFEALVPPGDFFAAEASAGSVVAAVPNPFARQTTISYEIAAPSDVRLAVYDVLGREVAVLVDGRQEAGPHAVTFDARGLAAGAYLWRLTLGGDVQTGLVTLTR